MKKHRYTIIPLVLALCAQVWAEDIIDDIDLEVVVKSKSDDFCWFHPRGGILPGRGEDGDPIVVITMQKWFTSASDYFSGLSVIYSEDLGDDWTKPDERPELAWRQEPNEVTVGVCDFTPGWHAPTGRLLGIGHTVRYKGGKLHPEPRPRETAYASMDPRSMTWTPWRVVDMPEDDAFFSAGSGCGQWLMEPNGDVLVPFYFRGPTENAYKATYASAVMRCTFDGEKLSYVEHGAPITHDVPRGVYEPSLARLGGKVYITMRNDQRGYVAVSDDGLNFGAKKPWTFDDGEELGSYNTQQHWVAHSDALYLAYTRKGADNDHIMRHRAPLFIAQVDPERLVVLRETERVLVPEKGRHAGQFRRGGRERTRELGDGGRGHARQTCNRPRR